VEHPDHRRPNQAGTNRQRQSTAGRTWRDEKALADELFCSPQNSFYRRGRGETLRTEHNEISGQIVDAAMKVHSALGPGLLESAYEACLLHEVRKRGLQAEAQPPLPLAYDGVILDVGYRVDLLVEQSVIVELKAVEKLLPIHEAQLLCYLRLSDRRLGLLINFNVLHLKDGIKRMVHNL
jgi:GxxExxY protein